MKNDTAFVKKIDDLGRIVLPKEIRRDLKIREGDEVSVSRKGNGVLITKFSIMQNFREEAKKFIDDFYETVKAPVVLCDESKILYTKGIKLSGHMKLSEEFLDCLDGNTESFVCGSNVTQNKSVTAAVTCFIKYKDDYVGALIIPDLGQEITESHMLCLQMCAAAIEAFVY